MSELISVIVPIYNVEKYLKKAVDCIVRQTYDNIEIILVDDGSTDNCGLICDEYYKKDNRIKVIHKENGGISDARNAGIETAKGEYFSFVDPDDWFEDNMIEVLYNKIKNVFNKLDENEILSSIEEDDDNNIKVYIGKENNIDDDITVIQTKFKKGNNEGTIAIIGPKRMEYERVVGLLEYMKENIER